jgi:hypothetical protein
MFEENAGQKIALIILIVAVVACAGFGAWFMSELGSPGKPETLVNALFEKIKEERDLAGPQDEHVKAMAKFLQIQLDPEKKGEIPELEGQIAGKEREIEETRWKIRVLMPQGTIDENEMHLQAVEEHYERVKLSRAFHLTHTKIRQKWHTHYDDARSLVSQEISRGEPGGFQDHSLQELRARKDKEERGYAKRRAELQMQIDEAEKELVRRKNRFDRRYSEKRDRRSRLETEYVGARDELQKLLVEEPAAVDVSRDGVILTVHLSSRQVVTNIGSQHGVRAGMRFEVFQLRRGGRHVRKGFIVVRSAGRETSNCIIMNKLVNLPRSAASGYTAELAEELFSPYDTGPGGGFEVERLRGSPKEIVMGMNAEDPIVEGDLIRNPLFEPNRQLHFAVKGDPLHHKYGTEEILKAIRWHGGVIDPEINSQTDILLHGKWATEEVRRANQLGVQVMHQSEVFDFIRP